MEQVVGIAAVAAISLAGGSCRGRPGDGPAESPSVLRIGLAQLTQNNPNIGLRQLAPLLTVESLARAGDDGRMQPWLADKWTPAGDGRSVTVTLKPGITFQDGSPLNAAVAAALLPDILRGFMGPMFADVVGVKASGPDSVDIELRERSPFLLEALEVSVRKPGPTIVGTGPYIAEANSMTSFRANNAYHQGPPGIARITVETYPSVRAAWAEMLRGSLDMLWEIGADALDSMAGSTTISTFTHVRHYQYLIALNPSVPALRAAEIRRALNFAIDRPMLVKNALNGRGLPSVGPVWPRHWAIQGSVDRFEFDAAQASGLFRRSQPTAARRAGTLHFTCLVPPDSANERLALEVKRQLTDFGVDMEVQAITQEEITHRAATREYEAVLIDLISGPNLFRPYLVWHSEGPLNWGRFGNATVDRALDVVRHAGTDSVYRDAIGGLQRAFMDDPPAIFLAWPVRARAVSKRFAIEAEEGRDVLSTLRMWRPAPETANRN